MSREAPCGAVAAVAVSPVPGAPADVGANVALDQLIRGFGPVIGADLVLLYALGTDRTVISVLRRWGPDAEVPGGGAPLSCAFAERALGTGRVCVEPLHPKRDAGLIATVGGRGLTHACVAPVRTPAGTVALLVAGFVQAPAQPAEVIFLAESEAALIGLSLHRPSDCRVLLEAARVDGLTGCLTFDGLRRELAREVSRSDRTNVPLTCCFLDLDGFKRINDRHGHPCGNEALAAVGQTLRRQVRSCDLVGRYGGDEFIAILPQTTTKQARVIAQRLQDEIAATRLPCLPGETLTASVGIAQWHPGTTADALLARADEALLAAKAQRAGDASIPERRPA